MTQNEHLKHLNPRNVSADAHCLDSSAHTLTLKGLHWYDNCCHYDQEYQHATMKGAMVKAGLDDWHAINYLDKVANARVRRKAHE